MDIVEEAHCQKALNSIAGGKTEEGHYIPVTVELRREPNNPYDGNAVQCLIDGQLVGYIDRDDAPGLQKTLRACEKKGRHRWRAILWAGGTENREGGSEGSYGAKINSPGFNQPRRRIRSSGGPAGNLQPERQVGACGGGSAAGCGDCG